MFKDTRISTVDNEEYCSNDDGQTDSKRYKNDPLKIRWTGELVSICNYMKSINSFFPTFFDSYRMIFFERVFQFYGI